MNHFVVVVRSKMKCKFHFTRSLDNQKKRFSLDFEPSRGRNKNDSRVFVTALVETV